jgi:uncharacterized protein (TIGR02453 family)
MATRTSVAVARFEGFADRDARFFRALARNQKREWFLAHKREYDQGWLGPMKALLAEVHARLEPLYEHDPLAEPKVFRIYRDVRFSKDKAPYKTHIGGYLPLGGTGDGPAAAAALYVHVGADEVFVAAGQYMMDGDQLRRFRAALLDARGAALAKILAPLTRGGYEIGAHDTLQRVPRGIDPDHPRAELLKRKGLILSFPTLPRATLTSHALVPWLVTRAKRTVPVVAWLAALT